MQWVNYELAGAFMLKKPQSKQKGANAAVTSGTGWYLEMDWT